jgi:hypothetical protein
MCCSITLEVLFNVTSVIPKVRVLEIYNHQSNSHNIEKGIKLSARSSRLLRIWRMVQSFWVLCTKTFPASLQESISRT